MLVLGIDTETTWTDPVNVEEARIIELGAVLYDTASKKPVDMFNILIDHDYEIHLKLEKLTGITKDMLSRYGKTLSGALNKLTNLAKHAEYFIAHNGNDFDKPILEFEYERANLKMPGLTWIDTRIDVPYPDEIKTRKLVYLAAEHGFANPFAHRAVFDVLTMMNVLSRYDLKEVVELAKQPTVTCIANVSYHDRQLAKDRGFYWDGDNKRWFKKMKKPHALKEQNEVDFNISILEE